jgi:hypothetical protein
MHATHTREVAALEAAILRRSNPDPDPDPDSYPNPDPSPLTRRPYAPLPLRAGATQAAPPDAAPAPAAATRADLSHSPILQRLESKGASGVPPLQQP